METGQVILICVFVAALAFFFGSMAVYTDLKLERQAHAIDNQACRMLERNVEQCVTANQYACIMDFDSPPYNDKDTTWAMKVTS